MLLLEGKVVLDFTNFLAGPYLSLYLSDLGADVIKIEPLDGDPYRAQGAAFMSVNRGKRSLCIDLKKAEAKSTIDDWKAKREAKKLAHRADRAEEYAAATIRVALASLDEAEQAVLEAVGARLDADEAEKTPVH